MEGDGVHHAAGSFSQRQGRPMCNTILTQSLINVDAGMKIVKIR
jgi:hypothetical protein